MATTDDFGFPTADAADVVRRALLEDLGPRHLDVTTLATIPSDQQLSGSVVARAAGVVAGVGILSEVLDQVATLYGLTAPKVEILVGDGASVTRGDVVARLVGATRVVLSSERTILNVMSRLSGVATHTRRWADALDGTGAMVLDTRKTTPGLRSLEKFAVRAGGGTNKRMGLYDVAMVKDNHKLAAGGVGPAYDAIRAAYPDVAIQVEVTTVDEAREAFAVGARFVMCDNMSVSRLAETVGVLRSFGGQQDPVEIEATGNLTLDVARAYAETGVDFLSVGGLTHSSPILDLALDLDPPAAPAPDRLDSESLHSTPAPHRLDSESLDSADEISGVESNDSESSGLRGRQMAEPFVTRPLRPADEARWRVLHEGYADFYAVPTSDDQRNRLWEWLIRHEHGLEGLVVEWHGDVVGIAHVRPVVRPVRVTVDGYLDDFYLDPSARGSGAAAALLHAVRRLAAERGWSATRWLTEENNARARSFYEREGATALPFVTYHLPTDLPAPRG